MRAAQSIHPLSGLLLIDGEKTVRTEPTDKLTRDNHY